MQTQSYSISSGHEYGLVLSWEFDRWRQRAIEHAEAAKSLRSARPIFDAVSGLEISATDLEPSLRAATEAVAPFHRGGVLRIEHIAVRANVHTASTDARPTPETVSAVISTTTGPWRDAAQADLWAQITDRCREVQQQGDERPDHSVPLKHARQLLTGLPETIELPQATVSFEGEIILTWFRGSNRLDAILDPEDHLTWVFRIGGAIEAGGDVALDEPSALDRFFVSVVQFYA